MNFILKMLADICFYLAFANFIVAAFEPPLAAGAAILGLPPLVYLIYNLVMKKHLAGMYDYSSTFALFFKAYIPFALFTYVFARGYLEAGSIPFAVLFLTLAVILMRTNRQHQELQKDMRFRIINLLPVAGFILLVIAVSSGAFFSVMSTLLSFLFFNVIGNILLVAAYAMFFIIGPIFSWFIDNDTAREMLENFGAGEQDIFEMDWGDDIVPRDFDTFAAVVTVIGTIVGIVLLVLLFRKLMSWQGLGGASEGIIQEYIPLEKLRKEKDRTTISPLRKQYRRFLKFCWKSGVPQEVSATSADYAKLSPDASRLRDIYIPVRYGGREATHADITNAKNLYKQIRKQGR